MLAVMYIENLPSSQSDGKLMKSRSILYKKKKIKKGEKNTKLSKGDCVLLTKQSDGYSLYDVVWGKRS